MRRKPGRRVTWALGTISCTHPTGRIPANRRPATACLLFLQPDSFDEGAEKKRPTVQVGDPFKEKLLLEACLELFQTDYCVGIQDMGAAGLTSSSFEMADRAGIEISAVQVSALGMLNSNPLRSTHHAVPWISASQTARFRWL